MAGFRGFKVMEINSNGCFPGVWMMINPYYQKKVWNPWTNPFKNRGEWTSREFLCLKMMSNGENHDMARTMEILIREWRDPYVMAYEIILYKWVVFHSLYTANNQGQMELLKWKMFQRSNSLNLTRRFKMISTPTNARFVFLGKYPQHHHRFACLESLYMGI